MIRRADHATGDVSVQIRADFAPVFYFCSMSVRALGDAYAAGSRARAPRMHVSMRARHGVTGVDPRPGFSIENVGGPIEVSALRIPLCPGVVRSATQPNRQAVRNVITASTSRCITQDAGPQYGDGMSNHRQIHGITIPSIP
jgi:hypothetical protein